MGNLNGLFDGAVTDATGAHPNAACRSVDEGANRLEIHVEDALGSVVGVADIVADHAPFAADVTYPAHVHAPFSLFECEVHATMNAAGLTR
jgi:hypothetical protein